MNQIDGRMADALNKVFVPGIMRSLVQMNLVRSAEVNEGKARVTLASTAIPAQHHESLKEQAAAAVNGVSGVEEVTVDLVQAKPKELNQIEKMRELHRNRSSFTEKNLHSFDEVFYIGNMSKHVIPQQQVS